MSRIQHGQEELKMAGGRLALSKTEMGIVVLWYCTQVRRSYNGMRSIAFDFEAHR